MLAKSAGKKVPIYILINVVLLIFLLAVLDWQNILPVRQWIGLGGQVTDTGIRAEDPLNVQKEEAKKRNAMLDEREKKIEELEASLEKEKEELEVLKNALLQKERELNEKEEQFENKKIEESNREQNIKDLAGKFMNMQPESAVDLLLGSPIMDVIDVMREMDRLAAEQGTSSIVPFFLQLMSQKDLEKAQEIIQIYGAYPKEREELLDEEV